MGNHITVPQLFSLVFFFLGIIIASAPLVPNRILYVKRGLICLEAYLVNNTIKVAPECLLRLGMNFKLKYAAITLINK